MTTFETQRKQFMKNIIHTPMIGLLVILFGFSACQTQTIQFAHEIAATPDSANVLRVQISFELSEAAEAYVVFWTTANPDKKYYSQLSPSARAHQITLVGLKGAATYQYQVHAFGAKATAKSKIGAFSTDKFPINILHMRWEPVERSGLSGYILSQRRMVNGIIYLIDDDGEVVWYEHIPKQPKLSHWTDRHTVLVLYGAARHRNSSGDQIVEYDLYGREQFHLDLSALDIPMEAHHEVRFDHEHNLLALMYDHQTIDLSDQGGASDQVVMGDKIVKMDTAGAVLWEWSVFDHLNPALDATILKTAEDWSHANSLSVDTDGHYLISFRNFNQVWKIDALTGDVIWKLGAGGTITVEPEGYFAGQHAFHVNAVGDYMVFDNGRTNRQTRILTYQINDEALTAEVKLNLPLPEDLYSDKMGNATLMDNGNILVCAPRTNSLVVIDTQGRLLARAKVGIPDPYRAEYVPELYPTEYVRR